MQSSALFAVAALALLAMGGRASERAHAATQPPATTAPAATAKPPLAAPSLFTGALPCADCEGIRYEIDLHTPEAFFLRKTYLGKPANNVFDDIGAWSLSSDGKVLLLSGRDAPEMFAIKDANTLRKLDLEGREILSNLNYTLKRVPVYKPLDPKLRMRGMYQHDKGQFEECLSGLRLQIAPEGGVGTLREAYAKASAPPQAAVLANLDGRILRRPDAKGDVLMVERTEKLSPNESCGERGVTHELIGTRWALVRLGEAPVMPDDNEREPYLALDGKDRRVSGFSGCERLNGSYQASGNQLTFSNVATTRKACANTDREAVFMNALETTATWRITGAHLELFDAAGVMLARFEARNL